MKEKLRKNEGKMKLEKNEGKMVEIEANMWVKTENLSAFENL